MQLNLTASIESAQKAMGHLVGTVFDDGSLKKMSVEGLVDANYNAKLNEAALNDELLVSDTTSSGLGLNSVSYDADMINDDAITPSTPN
jgi:hypothetical protein